MLRFARVCRMQKETKDLGDELYIQTKRVVASNVVVAVFVVSRLRFYCLTTSDSSGSNSCLGHEALTRAKTKQAG